MIRVIKLVIFLTLPFIAFALGANANDKPGLFGIGLNVVDPPPHMMLRFNVSKEVSLGLQFGIQHLAVKGEASSTRYMPGFGFQFHFRNSSNLAPLCGFGCAFDMLRAIGVTYTDSHIYIDLGAEYYFSKHFSINGEYQITFIITNDTFSPGGYVSDAVYFVNRQQLCVYFYF